MIAVHTPPGVMAMSLEVPAVDEAKILSTSAPSSAEGRRRRTDEAASHSVPLPPDGRRRRSSERRASEGQQPASASGGSVVVRRRISGEALVRRRVSSVSTAASRLPSIQELEKQTQAKQVAALEALIKSSRCGRSLEELAQAFLRPVTNQNGTPAFSSYAINQAVSKYEVNDGDSSTPGSDRSMALDHAGNFVAVVKSLGDTAGIPFSELASQLLWRNRRAKAIVEGGHRKISKDLTWLVGQPEDLEPVEEVFRCMTSPGNRMTFRHWQKVIDLIQKNPVLQSRIKLSDADRLFYGQCHRGGQANKNISMSEFKELLFEIAEASGIHPSLVFICVGSYARRLQDEAEEAAVDAAVETATSAGRTTPPRPPRQASKPTRRSSRLKSVEQVAAAVVAFQQPQ